MYSGIWLPVKGHPQQEILFYFDKCNANINSYLIEYVRASMVQLPVHP